MLVTLERKEWENFDDEELFRAVILPTVHEMHSGEAPLNKFEVYKKLTLGQRAVFMFWVLYDHSDKEIDQFYTWIPYMRESEQSYWPELKAGVSTIGDEALLLFLNDCEKTFDLLKQVNQKHDPNWKDYFHSDLVKHPELRPYVRSLHLAFEKIVPTTISIIGNYIRNVPNEFVQIKE
ncbi:hypothetical protein JNUCC31_05770 [Paenibacillus sp. JNUCC31]|uniref:hypothetical protein n=1 Tax=Paenibacillus sp. JNUCC-31 TaxID=2777983 RepID=UPI001783E587|nr:hypothetical protein [Paenibacillus sp. JNUCC-31]QOS80418.1 hypothetical protein JNUCC31_05770 [Paenibacillus sp. JNUCC-31]